MRGDEKKFIGLAIGAGMFALILNLVLLGAGVYVVVLVLRWMGVL